MKARSLFAPAVCVLVLAGVGLGFLGIGSPAHNRDLALDEAHIDAMRDIAVHLRSETIAPKTLPQPEFYALYKTARSDVTYARTGVHTYRLCATFALPSDAASVDIEPDFPAHPAGPVCFAFGAGSTEPQSTTSGK